MTSRVLIVDALSAGSGKRRSSRDSIGCGPRAVAGVLERHGIACRIRRVEEVISKPSLLRGFDHMAISAMTMDLSSARRVTRIWRGRRKRGRVLVGGPISSQPALLSDLDADVFIVGEGEKTLSEMIVEGYLESSVDIAKVSGLAYRNTNGIVTTGKRQLLSPVEISDDYRPSTTRIVDYPTYQASKVYVEAVRGCSNFLRTSLPLPDGRECSSCGGCDSDDVEMRLNCPEDIPPGCGFCSVPSTWGPPRSRTADAIVSEIRELVHLGVQRIVLEAPDFLDFMRGTPPLTDPCSPPANTQALGHLVQQINTIPLVKDGHVHITIENMKACLFKEPVAKVLTESGLSSSPNIGIETGSPKHMKQIGKCGSPADVLSAVRIAVDHGMRPFVYFIYGLPGENAQTVEQSIEMMQLLYDEGVERIILYGFRPLPGSAFEGFPPSFQEDELGKRLRREAERINRLRKDDYLDRTVRGIAAEPSWARRGYTMVYPLEEGPLMTVPGGYSTGTRLVVKITKVLSSGLVQGVVTEHKP